MNSPLCQLPSESLVWQSETISYIYMSVWRLFPSFLTNLPFHQTKHHSGVSSTGNLYIFKGLSIISFLAATAVLLLMFCACSYMSSQTNVKGHHLSHTKLHRAINTPTRHPQVVPSSLLNFPTHLMTINTCPNKCTRTAGFTPMHNFSVYVYIRVFIHSNSQNN
jgi:hypothetical protein